MTQRLAQEFIKQVDAYYASPASSFHDNAIARRFYQQKLAYLKWTPYPNDGLVTFGASGTDKCDRELFFKNQKGVKPEKSDDVPFRGRQRRQGSAIVEYFQLDIAHMPKRLGDKAKFKMAELPNGEYALEDATQLRQVFEVNGVKFAITAKPDGILDYNGRKLLFEYKTKATGVTEMNGKLDFKGAQDEHLRQVTAESILFGIREGLIVYESTQKPAWFSDEDKKAVPKTRKTWRNGEPIPDLRAFYFYITDEMQDALLADLARQADIVYRGEIPEMTVEMTSKCGFCPFTTHCKSMLTSEELAELREVETRMANSHMAGKYQHANLQHYLEGVGI